MLGRRDLIAEEADSSAASEDIGVGNHRSDKVSRHRHIQDSSSVLEISDDDFEEHKVSKLIRRDGLRSLPEDSQLIIDKRKEEEMKYGPKIPLKKNGQDDEMKYGPKIPLKKNRPNLGNIGQVRRDEVDDIDIADDILVDNFLRANETEN